MNHEQLLGEIKADLEWVKKTLENSEKKYASKWVEKAVYLGMTGMAMWVLNQVLNLIPTVKALFNG